MSAPVSMPERMPVAGSLDVEMDPAAARRARLLPLFVALIVLLVALANITPHLIGVFFDDAIYALVAKAIAEGQGFVYPQLPGTPPAIHYPPAFPLLLSLVWKIAPPFPDSTMWFKVVNPVVLSVAAWGAMRLAMRVLGWSPLAAAGVVLLGFVSVPTLVLTSVLLSEPLFLATLFPALLSASVLVERGGTKWAVLAGVAAAVLVLTRTVGGVILPAVVLVLLWDRRWREALIYASVTVALLVPWQLFVWKHAPGFPDALRGSYGPYLEWVVGGYRDGGTALVLAVVRKNVVDAWSFLGIFFSPSVRVARPAAAVLVIVAAVIGVLAGLIDRRTRVLALTTGAYLCVVFAWPYQIERFLWGAWPLLVLVAGHGLFLAIRAVRATTRPSLAWGVIGIALFLAVGHATYSGRGLTKGWAGSASKRMTDRMLPAVRYAIGEPRLRGKLLASDIAPVLALYTGERAISLDILNVTDHLAEKSISERAGVIAVLDRAFEPEAYVLLSDSPIFPAFLRAERDPARHFREFTATGLGVRAFLLDPQ